MAWLCILMLSSPFDLLLILEMKTIAIRLNGVRRCLFLMNPQKNHYYQLDHPPASDIEPGVTFIKLQPFSVIWWRVAILPVRIGLKVGKWPSLPAR